MFIKHGDKKIEVSDNLFRFKEVKPEILYRVEDFIEHEVLERLDVLKDISDYRIYYDPMIGNTGHIKEKEVHIGKLDKSIILHELQHLFQISYGWEIGGSMHSLEAEVWATEDRKTFGSIVGEIPAKRRYAGCFWFYQHLAGEVEARLVETRMDLSKEELDRTSYVLDVLEEDIIYMLSR